MLAKLFTKYSLIGVLNTSIHWGVFAVLNGFNYSQSTSNVIGFLVAATFSFVLNGIYTFKSQLNLGRYIIFLISMSLLSFAIGSISELMNFHPIVSLVSFSVISLCLGFFISNNIFTFDER